MPVDQPQIQPQNGNGMPVREQDLQDIERQCAVAIHLSSLAGLVVPFAFVVPLVLWLIKKDESVFIDDHGREVVNMMISALIFSVAATVLSFCLLLPALVLLVWCVVMVISMIRGAQAAWRSDYFRYPMILRILS
jgi:hypothetical protein